MSLEDRIRPTPLILLAGATGNVGFRIAQQLLSLGAGLRVLARRQSSHGYRLDALRAAGADVRVLNFEDPYALQYACESGTCLVSAVSGLEAVIIELQEQLLTAALAAGVPRFIPSDFCIDYTKLQRGSNRNLDLRRRFARTLDSTPIAATGILNGMFTELLKGQAPLIQQPLHRVMYWGNVHQPMDFTTIGDTAAYAVRVALDTDTPRYLRIAGDVQSIEGLAKIASSVYGSRFRTLRLGGTGVLKGMIALTRAVSFTSDAVFPAWQGMQYLHDMLEGRVKLTPLDNTRYPGQHWTPVATVLQGASDKHRPG